MRCHRHHFHRDQQSSPVMPNWPAKGIAELCAKVSRQFDVKGTKVALNY